MKRASNLSIVLIVLLLVVAACSNEPAASGSTSPDAATPTPAAATATPESSDDAGPSLPSLPSFGAGAGDLSAVVPTQIGGHAITYQHLAGDDPLFAEDMDDDALDFLERLDASPSDITTAFGFGGNPMGGEFVGVSAFRVAGADETRLREAYLAILAAEDDDFDAQPATIAGKSVVVFGDGEDDDDDDEGGEFNALYSRGDTLWIVFASTQELLEDALSQLP